MWDRARVAGAAVAVGLAVAVGASISACNNDGVHPTSTQPFDNAGAPSAAQPSQPPTAAGPVAPTASATGARPSVESAVYVPQSWLAATQLPSYSTYAWVAETSQPTVVPGPASGSTESSCNGIFMAIASNGGMNPSLRWYFDSKTPGSEHVQLVAHQYFFPDAAVAQRAFQQAQSDLSACASQPELDLQGQPLTNAVDRTASIANGFAYVHTRRSPTGEPYTALIPLIPYSHEYLVQHGRIIALIAINAGTPAIDVSSNDKAVLQQMANHLCPPNQPC